MKKDDLRFVGEVETEYVEIVTASGKVMDISKLVMSISLYEDIFSPFMSGRVVVKDSQDLANIFPLVGEEAIRFTARTPSIEDKKYAIGGEFLLYKMTDREELTDKTVVYILHFISLEAAVDLNKKISATLDGEYSSIARKLLQTNLGYGTIKPINIEETAIGTKFISNFWSPSKCLNYLSTDSINSNGSPTYMFFENRYGFNFVSLESLISNSVYQEFIGDNYANSQSNKDHTELYKRIIEISIPVAFDYMDAVSNGAYASREISYDLVTKKYSSNNFDSRNTFDRYRHLNEYSTNSNKMIAKSDAHIRHQTTSFDVFSNYGDVSNVTTKQQRKAVLTVMNMTKVEITVHGRTDYTVGQKVLLKLNKKAQVNAEDAYGEEEDKMFSGNYIISSIHHSISLENHICYIELMRESIPLEIK